VCCAHDLVSSKCWVVLFCLCCYKLVFAKKLFGLQQPFVCVLVCLNNDFTRFLGDYFQVFHGEFNLNWAWVP